MYRHRRVLTQKQIFTQAYYYKVGASGKALKCYFGALWLSIYRAVFIAKYQTHLELQVHWGLPTTLITVSYIMGKSWHHMASSSYRYLFAWGLIRASCLSYISNSPSRIGQKLNWNVTQALVKPYTSASSYTDSWCLFPFSSNIFWTVWGQLKWVSVLPRERNCSMLSARDEIPCRRERGIEVSYTARQFLYEASRHNYNSCKRNVS